MIVFDLECRAGQHRFEGWFGSSDDFARQQERKLVACPVCGSDDVAKAVMAPHVGRKGNQAPVTRPRDEKPAAPAPAAAPAANAAVRAAVTNAGPQLPPEAAAMLRAIALAQAEALKSSRWVGGNFAENARAMHYGEADPEAIHGQTTPGEAEALLEEGIEIAPVLFPLVPPEQAN
ncbi:MAG: DUF1178 family protein [Sphingomonadales bacterium]|nr:DUF1178 family protein [Sphingomonadales bacterium]MBU3992482.1 DUF1178 family protein [Alphaproteobacteria bacterium]